MNGLILLRFGGNLSRCQASRLVRSDMARETTANKPLLFFVFVLLTCKRMITALRVLTELRVIRFGNMKGIIRYITAYKL